MYENEMSQRQQKVKKTENCYKNYKICLKFSRISLINNHYYTDNAMEFNEKLQNDSLDVEGIRYAVFGLGK